MLTVFVTGYSKTSTDDALAKAMAQAASYIEKDHDVNISIVSLGEKDDGFEAVLKVVVIPMTGRADLDIQGQDVEYEHLSLQDYMRRKREMETGHQRRVTNMLSRHHGNFVPGVSDHDLNAISDEDALQDAFEKMFFQASHFGHIPDVPEPARDIPDIKAVLSRKVRPQGEKPEPE